MDLLQTKVTTNDCERRTAVVINKYAEPVNDLRKVQVIPGSKVYNHADSRSISIVSNSISGKFKCNDFNKVPDGKIEKSIFCKLPGATAQQ